MQSGQQLDKLLVKEHGLSGGHAIHLHLEIF